MDGKYRTLEQFTGTAEDKAAETPAPEQKPDGEEEKKEAKEPATVYYVSDEVGQAQYISMFKSAGLNAVVCDTFIDSHFISYLEFKETGKYKFLRIDADVDAALKADGQTDCKELEESFKAALKNAQIAVKAEKFKSETLPAVINVEEFMRRMSEMNSFYGMSEADMMKNATFGH